METILKNWVESDVGFVRKDRMVNGIGLNSWGGLWKEFADFLDEAGTPVFANEYLAEFCKPPLAEGYANHSGNRTARRTNRNNDMLPGEMLMNPVNERFRRYMDGIFTGVDFGSSECSMSSITGSNADGGLAISGDSDSGNRFYILNNKFYPLGGDSDESPQFGTPLLSSFFGT